MILANSHILPNDPGPLGSQKLRYRLVFRDSRYCGGRYPIIMPFETIEQAEQELAIRLKEANRHALGDEGLL